MYDKLPRTRLIAKKIATGKILRKKTSMFTFFSLTAGSIDVVADIICVSTVAVNMCALVRNIGYGKLNVLRIALLKRICL